MIITENYFLQNIIFCFIMIGSCILFFDCENIVSLLYIGMVFLRVLKFVVELLKK